MTHFVAGFADEMLKLAFAGLPRDYIEKKREEQLLRSGARLVKREQGRGYGVENRYYELPSTGGIGEGLRRAGDSAMRRLGLDPYSETDRNLFYITPAALLIGGGPIVRGVKALARRGRRA